MSLEADILADVQPTPTERATMAQRAEALIAACRDSLQRHGITGEPTVQGSIAKDTWLAGSADVDCFILLPPEMSEDQMREAAERVGTEVLENPKKKYAQHPYIIGTFDGADVDLVPAYKVAEAGDKMSAVDRTPFHTRWVQEHLNHEGRTDVLLLKKWCKGVGIYGAETSIGGFSGYLLEVLVHHFGGFHGVLAWMAQQCNPRRIAGERDAVQDDVSPLIVVDPVDAARNCAAAVQPHVIARAARAAQAYTEAPARVFFHPPPAKAEGQDALQEHMHGAGTTWLGLMGAPTAERLDIVFPQFQKAARTVATGLERAGFTVLDHDVCTWDNDATVGFQWLVEDATLPATRIQKGPRAGQEPNVTKFREKWDTHPDAASPITEVDGRLQLSIHVRDRTPHQWLQSNLATMPFGKHVAAALGATPKVGTAPWNAVPAWAPRVADFVLERDAWQRVAS